MPYRTAALTFAGVMFGFKIWSIFLIYLVAGEDGTTAFLLGTHVLWIALPLALIAPVLVFWFRLVRARRKRQLLLDAEWNIHQEPPVNQRSSDS